jgi:hypothetical protein
VHDHDLATKLIDHGFSHKCINEWGFKKFGAVREIKTNSVAAKLLPHIVYIHGQNSNQHIAINSASFYGERDICAYVREIIKF